MAVNASRGAGSTWAVGPGVVAPGVAGPVPSTCGSLEPAVGLSGSEAGRVQNMNAAAAAATPHPPHVHRARPNSGCRGGRIGRGASARVARWESAPSSRSASPSPSATVAPSRGASSTSSGSYPSNSSSPRQLEQRSRCWRTNCLSRPDRFRFDASQRPSTSGVRCPGSSPGSDASGSRSASVARQLGQCSRWCRILRSVSGSRIPATKRCRSLRWLACSPPKGAESLTCAPNRRPASPASSSHGLPPAPSSPHRAPRDAQRQGASGGPCAHDVTWAQARSRPLSCLALSRSRPMQRSHC